MTYHTRFVSLLATGLVASVGLADPADVSDAFDTGPRSAASMSWLTYIGGVMGPSNVAPGMTDSPARQEQSLNSMLYLTLAGPSNTSIGSGVALNLDLGGAGDGPGSDGNEFLVAGPAPDLLVSLQTADQPVVVTHGIDPVTETDPGEFQVVVPLPSAGVLAAGGLAFVAVRRRRS